MPLGMARMPPSHMSAILPGFATTISNAFFRGQVIELGQHILGGAVIKGRLVVGVLKPLPACSTAR